MKLIFFSRPLGIGLAFWDRNYMQPHSKRFASCSQEGSSAEKISGYLTSKNSPNPIKTIPVSLLDTVLEVNFSVNTEGYLLAKNKLIINKYAYWVPCKEFTKAGLASEIEKSNKNSDAAPLNCPPINTAPS